MKWWHFRFRFVLLLVAAIFLTHTTLGYRSPLYDPFGVEAERSKRSAALNDIVQIVNAVRNFSVDYRHPPLVTENGFCETAESNVNLIRILRGEDTKGNPRRIRYIEVQNAAQKKGIYRRGIHPETGAWLDPWGNFYRVRLKRDSAPFYPFSPISNPYTADSPPEIDTDCIVWSLGSDGLQGKRNNPHTKKLSDDITSWETQ